MPMIACRRRSSRPCAPTRGCGTPTTEVPGQPAGYLSVQQEVTRALRSPADFSDVVPGTPDAALKSSGRARDTMDDERPAYVVEDGTYISARWPGDVHTFAKRLSAVL